MIEHSVGAGLHHTPDDPFVCGVVGVANMQEPIGPFILLWRVSAARRAIDLTRHDGARGVFFCIQAAPLKLRILRLTDAGSARMRKPSGKAAG